MRERIEAQAWDGAWYRRAYFDDGSPLGSLGNAECQIDSVAQSWSVLSGAGDAGRSRAAMDAVYARLVRRDHALIQLLDPPFDKSALEPGYIRGYVPGVRENGGQYTHGAIWTAMAFAELGDSARAWELTSMINPVNHARTPEAAAAYKVEPYVVAADVYALAPHTGRGGWTWYTGSAGWMYRLVVESLLGLRLEGDRLRIAPCLPPEWTGFTLRYRYPRNHLRNRGATCLGDDIGSLAATRVLVDGVAQEVDWVLLVRRSPGAPGRRARDGAVTVCANVPTRSADATDCESGTIKSDLEPGFDGYARHSLEASRRQLQRTRPRHVAPTLQPEREAGADGRPESVGERRWRAGACRRCAGSGFRQRFGLAPGVGSVRACCRTARNQPCSRTASDMKPNARRWT